MFVLATAVLQDDLLIMRDAMKRTFSFSRLAKAKTHPDICVLVNLSQVQHVVHGQHPRRSLGEVHGRVHVVLHLKDQNCDMKTRSSFINVAG